MSRSVYLHVGIAKTGTTYLQRTLFTNRDLLRRNGVLYPGPDSAAHFLASLDLRDTTFKGHVYPGTDGAWGRLVAQAKAFGGDTLISHETLAQARPVHIEAAVRSLAKADVQVVVTVRDLARQIPASWQELLKNRGEVEYDEFVAQLFAGWRHEIGGERGFWRAQDPRGVVTRWAEAVGIGNITLVTVPPAGADRRELWRRFARATNLPDVPYELAGRDNPSLGVGEAELLRRLNPKFATSLDWPAYDLTIKKHLAEAVLGSLNALGRLRLPPRWHAELADIAAAEIDFLEHSGVAVVGDLRDLEPVLDADTESARQPGDLSDADLLDVALEVVAVLSVTPPPAVRPDRGRDTLLGSRRLLRTARKWRDVLPQRFRQLLPGR